MKNTPNPLAVGMFVLGAALVSTIVVLLYGASKFFTENEMFVSYFSESVNGLTVGAPIKYRGVQIGKVERIGITAPIDEHKEGYVAVVCSIDIGTVSRRIGQNVKTYTSVMESQIKDGLRAKLNYQSIVTGMLYIELDYFAPKNAPITLVNGDYPYLEVPSVATGFTEMAKSVGDIVDKISKVDFGKIATHADELLVTANTKLSDIDTKALSDSAAKLLADADALAGDPHLKESVANLNALLLQSQTELAKISSSTRRTMENADSLMQNVNALLAPDSPVSFELTALMRSLNESLSSLSSLLDSIERNPNSIFTGRLKREKSGE